MSSAPAEASPCVYDPQSWNDAAFTQQHLCTRAGLGEAAVVASSKIEFWTGHGGANGEMFFLDVEFKENAEAAEVKQERFIFKTTRANGAEASKNMGLAREGIFLRKMWIDQSDASPLAALKPMLPRCLWADGDMSIGRKAMVMKRIDGIQSGYFFGKHSPHNWDKDLEEETKDIPGVTECDVCTQAAVIGATLHAKHLGDKATLFSEDYQKILRAAQWFQGEGRETWEATMNQSKNVWINIQRPNIDANGVQTVKGHEDKIHWTPEVVALMDASFAKVSWEEFQKSSLITDGRMTLVHGDFHPGNMLVTRGEKKLILVDWEVIGVGSGPQDLGQYMLSHSNPDVRRQNTKTIIDAYTDTFRKNLTEEAFAKHFDGKDEVLREWVLREYAVGGVARWIWLLPLCGLVFEPKKQEYFVRQLVHMLEDFPRLYQDVPIPRA